MKEKVESVLPTVYKKYPKTTKFMFGYIFL